MLKKLIFIVIILAVATFAAYKFGLFNKKAENVIEKTIEKTKRTAEKTIEKTKDTAEKTIEQVKEQ